MTPRQKANQLFNRYQDEVGMFKFDAKHSALIAVEEIIESLEVLENTIDKIDNVNLSIFFGDFLSNRILEGCRTKN